MKNALGNLTQSQRFTLTLVSLICVVGLEVYALYRGVNGLMLTAAIGGLTAIVGLAYGIKIGKTGT